MYIYNYIVWATVLTPSYTDSIIAALVKRGYAVSSLSKDICISIDENASGIITLKVGTSDESKLAKDIYNDIIQILDEIKAFYYSVVITEYMDNCIWSGSNISISKKKPPSQGDKETKSKLN